MRRKAKEKYCDCVFCVGRILSCIYAILKAFIKLICVCLIKAFSCQHRVDGSNSSANENDSHLSITISKLIKNLDDFFDLDRDSGAVLSIKGSWGIGKTYFWNKYASEKFEKNKYVYISLFGLSQIDDIRAKILNGISRRVYFSNKVRTFFGSTRLVGFELGSMISAFGMKEFSGLVVCIDDFERISPNLNISEVLGFISELKESHKCTVVIINNNDQLEDLDRLNRLDFFSLSNGSADKEKALEKHRYSLSNTNNHKIFSSYLEKILDEEFEYNPNIRDQVKIAARELSSLPKLDIDLVADLFASLDSNRKNNIRLMKRFFNKTGLFKLFYNDDIPEEVANILTISLFEFLFEVRVNRGDLNGFKFNRDVFFKDNLIAEVISEVCLSDDTNLILAEELNKAVALVNVSKKQEADREKDETQLKKISECYFKYMYDLRYLDDVFVKDFYKFLNVTNVVALVGLETFNFYVEEFLIKLDSANEECYVEFYKTSVRKFFEDNKNIDEDFFNVLNLRNSSQLSEHAKSVFHEVRKNNTDVSGSLNFSSLNDFINLVKPIVENKDYSYQARNALSVISNEQHEKMLLESRDYFKAVFDLMVQLDAFAGEKPLEDFYRMTLSIYKKIYDENHNLQNKMKYILNRFNITYKEK